MSTFEAIITMDMSEMNTSDGILALRVGQQGTSKERSKPAEAKLVFLGQTIGRRNNLQNTVKATIQTEPCLLQ